MVLSGSTCFRAPEDFDLWGFDAETQGLKTASALLKLARKSGGKLRVTALTGEAIIDAAAAKLGYVIYAALSGGTVLVGLTDCGSKLKWRVFIPDDQACFAEGRTTL
jgi:hypothetical protein